jgi:hypothetical protein
MQQPRDLNPCLIGTGTLTTMRDMVHAMETVEAFSYRYTVDGEEIAEGRGTLVKIMADPESSTMLVNGCLFLNVASFRYLDFTATEAGTCFELHGDGALLELVATEDVADVDTRALRVPELDVFDPQSFVVLDEEDDED